MASTIAAQASPAEGCPLLKLPAELRLRIYHYTQELRLEIDTSGFRESMNMRQSWGSTPLASLAATCSLVANEARDFVRSLSATRRVAHVEILGSSRHHWMQMRLRHLPCPLIELKRIFLTCDFQKYRSAADFPEDDGLVKEAMLIMQGQLWAALAHMMIDESLENSTSLENFGLHIKGLQRNASEVSRSEAVRRILNHPATDRASGERLVQEIHQRTGREMDVGRGETFPSLAVCKGRPLYLLV